MAQSLKVLPALEYLRCASCFTFLTVEELVSGPFLQDMVEDGWILGLANLGDSQSVASFLSPLLSNQRGAVFVSPGFL